MTSTGITQSELDLIRENQLAFMPTLVRIRRLDATDGDAEYADAYTEVPARITPGFGTWRQSADRFQGITPFQVTMPWDQDVKAGDEVVDVYGRTFRVRDVLTGGSYITAKKSLCDLIEDTDGTG